MILEIHKGERKGETNRELNFDSNPVTEKEFGEYVASLHSCSNGAFTLQYQVQLSRCSFIFLNTLLFSPWYLEKRVEKLILEDQRLIDLSTDSETSQHV